MNIFVCLEYFRCQGNGRFSDVSNCHHGRYFECVYYGQRKLKTYIKLSSISICLFR